MSAAMGPTKLHRRPGPRGASERAVAVASERLRLPSWAAPSAVCALTALGFGIRLVNFDQSLFGDELSTAWIVHGRSLSHVVGLVYSDKEITPPLSFMLSWAALKIGHGWEWIRLPSIAAGTVTIPIVYATGVRVSGRSAGLIAAAITALSAVMIMYSTEARNYAVMMACVAASTLAVLVALDTRRVRWWVLYGLASCLAMYSHYSAAFVLIAQGVWVLWFRPQARRPVLLANLLAAVAYAPWIPGWIHDTHSVTLPIINALVPFSPGVVGRSIADWAVGYPYQSINQAPGRLFALLIAGGVTVALVAVAVRTARGRRLRPSRTREALAQPTALIGVIAISTLVGETIFSAFGTHILDSRDLNPSWPALAVALGVVVSAAGPLLGSLACALVLTGYGAGAADTLQTQHQRPDYSGAAEFISARGAPGDVVLDGSNVPVVPLTPLEAYLPRSHPVFTLGLPEGPPPYTLASKVPPAGRLVAEALRSARHGRLFLLTGGFGNEANLAAVAPRLESRSGTSRVLGLLPPGSRVIQSRRLSGIETLVVSEISLLPRDRAASG